jgi:NAD(P)-dependent dehydrogenase (short-subunit alcohol dehydrogenase family)
MADVLHRIFSLEGKTALVTGAGGGIGCVLAVALAEAGAQVQRGAALRDLQAMPVSMAPGNREAFLGALGTQNALMEARQASARDISQMDVEAAQAQREEISTLAGTKARSEAARKAAFFNALGGVAQVGGEAVTAQAIRKEDLKQKALAERAAVDAELEIAEELRRNLGTQEPVATGALGNFEAFLTNPSPTFR